MTDTIEQYDPVFVSFLTLYAMFEPLHMGVQSHVDGLYDIWRLGSPSPDSIIRAPKGYDERKVQRGNDERRLLMFLPLAKWIVDVSTARSMPYTLKQAMNILHGKADYGFDQPR